MAGWEDQIIQARFLIAALGESASPPWWRTQALTPAGLRMFERLYPRTAPAAGLETAGRAARTVHDERIAYGDDRCVFALEELTTGRIVTERLAYLERHIAAE